MLAAAWGEANPSPLLMTEDEQRRRRGGKNVLLWMSQFSCPFFFFFSLNDFIVLIPSSLTKAKQRIPFIRWSVSYL